MSNKRIVILATLVLSALLGLLIYLNYAGTSTIKLNAPADLPNGGRIQVEIKRESKVEKSFEMEAGQSKSIRLKNGLVRIDSSASGLSAVDIVEIGKTKELTTPSATQHKTQKIASNATFCPVVLENTIFSYNCFGDGIVVRHPSETQSLTMYNSRQFTSLRPLGSGLVGFSQGEPARLIYLDLPSETAQPVAIPPAAQTALNTEFPLIATSSEPGGTRFALLFRQSNKVFLFDSIADSTPTEITPPVDLKEEGRAATVSFSGNELILYAGMAPDSHEGDGGGLPTDDRQRKDLPVFLYEYDLSGKLARTLEMPKGFDAIAMYKLTDKYYEAERIASFEVYYLDGGKLREVYDAGEVSSWVNFKGTVYLQTGEVMYQFAPGSNGLFGFHSVFAPDELKTSQVFASVRGLVFTGYGAGSDDLDIYQLLDELVDPKAVKPPSVRIQTQFSGLGRFIDLGVSSDQVEGLKKSIQAYLDKRSEGAESATVDNIVIIQPEPSAAVRRYKAEFDLKLDSKKFEAVMEYYHLTEMRLLLYDQSSRLLFDSDAP